MTYNPPTIARVAHALIAHRGESTVDQLLACEVPTSYQYLLRELNRLATHGYLRVTQQWNGRRHKAWIVAAPLPNVPPVLRRSPKACPEFVREIKRRPGDVPGAVSERIGLAGLCRQMTGAE